MLYQNISWSSTFAAGHVSWMRMRLAVPVTRPLNAPSRNWSSCRPSDCVRCQRDDLKSEPVEIISKNCIVRLFQNKHSCTLTPAQQRRTALSKLGKVFFKPQIGRQLLQRLYIPLPIRLHKRRCEVVADDGKFSDKLDKCQWMVSNNENGARRHDDWAKKAQITLELCFVETLGMYLEKQQVSRGWCSAVRAFFFFWMK